MPRLREDLLVHSGFVHALARATLRGDGECEDLEQDVWQAALVGAPVEPSRQRPWLVAVLRRRAADLLRRRSRRQRREARATHATEQPSTADAVERAESGRRLVHAVLALEEPFRTAVLLRFQDGLTPRAIAARLDVPVETVRSRVRRGLERLRVLLSEREQREGRDARALLLPWAFKESPTGPVSAAIEGGLLVSKKLIAVAAGVLALLGGLASLRLFDRGRVDSTSTPTGPAVLQTDPNQAKPVELASAPKGVVASAAAAAAPAAPAGKVVRGRIVGDADQPIAGAVVRGVSSNLEFFQTGITLSDEATTWPSGRSDADGKFELPVADARGNGMVVRVRADGWHFPIQPWVSGTYLTVGADATLRLVRGVELEVRVVDDASGSPIPRANVAVYQTIASPLFQVPSTDEETADEAGRAVLRVDGGEVRVLASAPGYAEREGEAQNVGPGGERSTIRLRRGGTLDVEIVDAEGHPVAGARVGLLRSPAVRAAAAGDARGHVRFEHLPALESARFDYAALRLVFVVAEAEGFVQTWGAIEAPAEAGVAALRIVLARPRTIFGRVRSRDGSPVSAVGIAATTQLGRDEWRWEPTPARAYAKSGADGRFELKDVTPGNVTVAAHRTSAGVSRPVSGDGTRVVNVPVDGPAPDVDLVIDGADAKPVGIAFRVLDPSGTGVEGARVSICSQRPKGANDTSLYASARTTDAAGRVIVTPEGDAPWWVLVESPKSGPILRAVTKSDVSDEPIDVRPGTGRIEGRALRLDGSPSRVRLALACPVRLPTSVLMGMGDLGAVETDASGAFVFVGVGEGVTDVRSLTPGLTVLADPSRVVGKDSRELRLVVIDEAEAASLRIDVDVLDAASGVAISITPQVDVSRVGAEGYDIAHPVPGSPSRFRTQAMLAAGTWHVRASAEGYQTAEVDVTVAAGKASAPVRLLLEKNR